LKVWDLSAGRLLKDLSLGQKDIRAVRFADAGRFQTGDDFGRVTTWSSDDFKAISTSRVFPCGDADQRRHSSIYSPDFSLIASQCRKSLVVTNVWTGKVIKRLPKEEHYRLPSFSRDGKTLLLPDTTHARIVDLRANSVQEFDEFDGGELNSVGSLIAALPNYRSDGVRIFDTKTGRRRGWLVGHPGVVNSLAFSPDGSTFASGSADRVVRIWETRSGKILLQLEGHSDKVQSVRFGEDGKTLTSQSEKETIVWDVLRGVKLREVKEERRFEGDGGRHLSPSGRLALVEEHEKPFRLVNAVTDETIKEFVYIDQLDNLVFCPDEKHFLAKPWWGGWQLWSVEGGSPLREFDVGYSFYNRVAFHPDGKTFITGGEGQNIFMFNLESGAMLWSLFPIDRREFEGKKASEARRVASINREKEMSRLADIENAPYKNRVYITFAHYGDMTPPGEQKIAETGEPDKSRIKRSAVDANAVWLSLHNDSPLPVSVPTQSMYVRGKKCHFEFPDGQRVYGLCGREEISVWLSLEDKDGNPLRYGFDFGSSVVLLPGKFILFAVPLDVLTNGNAISFAFTFQKPDGTGMAGNFGNAVTLKFRGSSLPKE
jgi:WD40 repeat protein